MEINKTDLREKLHYESKRLEASFNQKEAWIKCLKLELDTPNSGFGIFERLTCDYERFVTWKVRVNGDVIETDFGHYFKTIQEAEHSFLLRLAKIHLFKTEELIEEIQRRVKNNFGTASDVEAAIQLNRNCFSLEELEEIASWEDQITFSSDVRPFYEDELLVGVEISVTVRGELPETDLGNIVKEDLIRAEQVGFKKMRFIL